MYAGAPTVHTMGLRFEGVVQPGYASAPWCQAEDHRYAPCRVEGDIPGLACQTLHPKAREPPEPVELIADRHLRTSLKLHDGDRICFELARTDPSSRRPLGRMLIAG